MELKDIQILEWSKKQNAFHIHPITTAIEKNINALIANDDRDYVPVMAGSREDCEVFASKYRERLLQREQGKSIRSLRKRA